MARIMVPNLNAPTWEGAYPHIACPCINQEKPLCGPDCWHFGFHNSTCRTCGHGKTQAVTSTAGVRK